LGGLGGLRLGDLSVFFYAFQQCIDCHGVAVSKCGIVFKPFDDLAGLYSGVIDISLEWKSNL
jgi:hypothetical protein